MCNGARRVIGNGKQMRVWTDKWILDTDPRVAVSIQPHTDPQLKVSDLLEGNTNVWNVQRLRELMNPTDIPLILSVRPARNLPMDGYCWPYTRSGNYTVWSGYEVLRRKVDEETQFLLQQPSVNALKAHVWKVANPNKIRHFLWQSLSGALAVNERLSHRHLRVGRNCPRCGHLEETINNTLFTCPDHTMLGTFEYSVITKRIPLWEHFGRTWITCIGEPLLWGLRRKVLEIFHGSCGISWKLEMTKSLIILTGHRWRFWK